MSWFSKKEEAPEKPKSYTVKTTVSKVPSSLGPGHERYKIVVEGSGFTGTGIEFSLSSAFESAYKDLMHQVSEAIFTDNG